VPAFAFPEAAVVALGRAWRYEEWRQRDHGRVLSFADIDVERIRAVVRVALDARPTGTLLPLSAASEVLDAAGVPFAPARAVATRAALLEAADDLGYPVALKALGLTRPARSESSGVALDLQSRAEVDAAFVRMSSALGAPAVAEVSVQKMVPGGVETRVVLDVDPTFGPVVVFGLGGAFADVIDDTASRAVPLTDVDVRDLVASSRAASVIGPPDAVIDVVARVAALAEAVPEIVRLDLNPVLVSPEGAWAVGVAVRVAPADAPPPFPVRGL
jgi:acyl-CoA synthetase (NDP forming)